MYADANRRLEVKFCDTSIMLQADIDALTSADALTSLHIHNVSVNQNTKLDGFTQLTNLRDLSLSNATKVGAMLTGDEALAAIAQLTR